MRGPKGLADLEGDESKAPLYPYLLFALACEVGLKTETAALVAQIAAVKTTHKVMHPLVVCLFSDDEVEQSLTPLQIQLRERIRKDDVGQALFIAVRAVYLAATGQDPRESKPAEFGEEMSALSDPIFVHYRAQNDHFLQAFAEAARFTFRSSGG
ncbi:hypothetical protein [Bradyrhizobium sp. RT5a]